MSKYYHSVKLDVSKCVGCTSCLKRCPTEAIRVRERRAFIIENRCIDCGECIRTCEHHAKIATTNPLEAINRYPYKIALFAPALYGQFKDPEQAAFLPDALRMMGFDDVYSVATGADIVTVAIQNKLRQPDCPRPLISSSCPAVVRLIQIRFPELVDNIVDVRSPMEVSATEARRKFCETRGVEPGDVGCFFITPCAAKMTAIRNPLGHETSAVNGAISFLDIYGLLSGLLRKHKGNADFAHSSATGFGVNWARTAGEALALGVDDALAVDGIDNVIRVLEEIDNNRLSDLVYFEGLACLGGCVGGPLTFENMFIARNRIRQLILKLPKTRPEARVRPETMASLGDALYFESPLESNEEALRLDGDRKTALEKMERAEQIRKRLPGLDCGSCGSPTCQALAEDIIQGDATELNCIHLLRERLRYMASQMVEMSESTRE